MEIKLTGAKRLGRFGAGLTAMTVSAFQTKKYTDISIHSGRLQDPTNKASKSQPFEGQSQTTVYRQNETQSRTMVETI